nr:hypothetical protein CFP56_58205 [Quercus suber]
MFGKPLLDIRSRVCADVLWSSSNFDNWHVLALVILPTRLHNEHLTSVRSFELSSAEALARPLQIEWSDQIDPHEIIASSLPRRDTLVARKGLLLSQAHAARAIIAVTQENQSDLEHIVHHFHLNLNDTPIRFTCQSWRADIPSLLTQSPRPHTIMAYAPQPFQPYGYCESYFVENHDDDDGLFARAAAERENQRGVARLRQKALAADLSRRTAGEYQEDILNHMERMEVGHMPILNRIMPDLDV